MNIDSNLYYLFRTLQELSKKFSLAKFNLEELNLERFSHLAKHICKKLDNQSLTSCTLVEKPWKNIRLYARTVNLSAEHRQL